MDDLPRHSDDDGNIGEQRQPSASRPRYLWWLGGITLVLLMLVLHLAGVFGPGTH